MTHRPVCIVGLGLMGGSLALALKRAGWCAPILGVSRNRGTLLAAMTAHAIDVAVSDLAEGVGEAGIVILATPVRTLLSQIPQVGEVAAPGTLIMDLGSTKTAICEVMNLLPEGLQPIGGHPMCGKELSGFAAADADLYHSKTWVMCPLPRTSPGAASEAKTLAEATGARTLTLAPEEHDRAVAAISHLPYAAAVALMNAVIAEDDPLTASLASSGFRDTTRVAGSDVSMMLDVLLTNRRLVLEWLDQYAGQLGDIRRALAEEDEIGLRGLLEQGQRIRSRMKF